jgi:hypothetical protein
MISVWSTFFQLRASFINPEINSQLILSSTAYSRGPVQASVFGRIHTTLQHDATLKPKILDGSEWAENALSVVSLTSRRPGLLLLARFLVSSHSRFTTPPPPTEELVASRQRKVDGSRTIILYFVVVCLRSVRRELEVRSNRKLPLARLSKSTNFSSHLTPYGKPCPRERERGSDGTTRAKTIAFAVKPLAVKYSVPVSGHTQKTTIQCQNFQRQPQIFGGFPFVLLIVIRRRSKPTT